MAGTGGSTWRRLGAGAAALALLVAGCGDDDDAGGDAATTTEAPADDGGETTTTAAPDEGDEGDAGATEVTGVDFGFEGLPEELPGGAFAFTFTNAGEVDHEIAFVEMGDTDPEQFFEDFGPVVTEGGAFPDYAENLLGAVEATPGESGEFVFTLPEGRYMAFCALTGTLEDPGSEEGEPHFAQGMQQVVTVGAPEGAVALPEADGTITATDYTFDADLSGGDTTINFVNDGPSEVHFASISVYPEGTSAEDAEASFAQLLESDGPPPAGVVEPEEVGFSGIASAGEGVQFDVVEGFEAGRTYVFVCFIQDRVGGPPHAIGYQMFKAFTVE